MTPEEREQRFRDAILHACGANTEHGRRRSGEDKRKAVMILLEEIKGEPAKDWSNYRVAEICKVSEAFVRKVKVELRGEGKPDAAHGAQTMEVENNGENIDSSSIRDRPTPAQRVQSKTDTLDGRLMATEVAIFRVQKMHLPADNVLSPEFVSPDRMPSIGQMRGYLPLQTALNIAHHTTGIVNVAVPLVHVADK
jgi:hypothetical protein